MTSRSQLSLVFVERDSKTKLYIQRQDPPWRAVRAFEAPGGEALLHIHNLSGGLLGGDQLDLTIQVRQNAQAQVTTTGATRIYKCAPCRATPVQTLTAHLESNTLFEYLPDQVIPYADSSYNQETTIRLEGDNAGLFWWEAFSPGRTPYEDPFTYQSIRLRSTIFAGQRPIAAERLLIEPNRRSVLSPARLSSYLYFTTFYICKTGVGASTWQQLETKIADLTEARSVTAQWGVSMLVSHGLVVRGLGGQFSELYPVLLEIWDCAKRFLYDRPAVPPRKLY